MYKKMLIFILMLILFAGCHGKPPAPQTHEDWVKLGYSPSDVYNALLACGFNRRYNQIYGLTHEQIAEGEFCMTRNGFKLKEGHHITCDFYSSKDLSACQEYIRQKGVENLITVTKP